MPCCPEFFAFYSLFFTRNFDTYGDLSGVFTLIADMRR